MLTGEALRHSLEVIPPIRIAGVYWRVVTASSLLGLVIGSGGQPTVTRLNPKLLFAGGPGRVGGRYTPIGGPDTLYLASSERAANAEWEAGLSALFPNVHLPPKVVFSANIVLDRVLDLSADPVRQALETNVAELSRPWKARKRTATQELGFAVFNSGRFSALRYRSTKAAPSYCMAIFPDRLESAENVSVLDPKNLFKRGITS
jgi:RES domain-containing protein